MAGMKQGSRWRLAASLLLACAILAPALAATTPAQATPALAIQPQAPSLEDFKAVLSGYGQFIYSERYGNVWKPSAVPAGWHPYPACHWVYDRNYGWTYDDPTAWGKIIHHYGRWASDGSNGWVWLPGTQWAPAWVIWRSGGDWTGWAPTPPAADQQEVSLANFNVDRQWIFIESAKLANRCDNGPAAVPAGTFAGSAPVTSFKIVRGIAIFVLPPPATVIDYDTGPIAPWSSEFLGEWLLWLNTAAASTSLSIGGIPIASCPPPAPAVAPAATPIALPAPAAARIRPWQPPPPRSIRRRADISSARPRPAYSPPPPDYAGEPPFYGPPPHRRPVWHGGPVAQRPPRYPRPGPVVIPPDQSASSNSGRRYRRPPPGPYGGRQLPW